MLNVRKPKARTLGSKGFTIDTKEDPNTILVNSPVTPSSSDNNDTNDNSLTFITTTPTGSSSDIIGQGSSAFELVSPPKIQRKVRVNNDNNDNNDTLSTKLLLAKGSAPQNGPNGTQNEQQQHRSPCDTTQATSLQSHGSPLILTSNTNETKKSEKGNNKKSSNFKNQIKQIKLNLPKALKKHKKKKSATTTTVPAEIDLSHLAIATICIVPRHGAGMAAGRMPFERIRTSVLMHMMQENENASEEPNPEKKYDTEAGDGTRGGVAKLNMLLRKCMEEKETCFVEKSQEVVRLANDALEELTNNNDDTDKSLANTDLGQRNLTCVKFLSGMYREVIADEKQNDSRDGLSLMAVAGAYYALGKFDPALSVYQRAGIELRRQISTTSPEYTVHCAKLFNNMGCVYFERNKYEKAMQTFQRALQLFHNDDREDDYGVWSAAILDQASIMNNMAYTLIKFKQYEDASDLVDASFELQQILPVNNQTNTIMTISSLSTMAFIYYRTKQYKHSLDTYSACVQLQDKSAMCNESDQVEVLKKMADICKKIRDHEKRVYLLRTILVYQQCYLLEDDDEIWDTHAALAETLQAFADSGGTSI
mmetsp:Transcript_10661/g.23260  ORF Transcript_10661/g.23260 Transcript_10661/m.23260 type:complete len:593 (+) Transcript_10661:128-1906(+)